MWGELQQGQGQAEAACEATVRCGESLAFDADGLQVCGYRREVPLDGEGPGAVEVRCTAMGGGLLGHKEKDLSQIRAVCNACAVPREAARRPCLYLVPFKAQRDGEPRDYFACRWFYKLKPEDPHTTTAWMCGGCQYWFPMPPLHLLKDLEGKARYMIAYHNDYWANPPKRASLFAWNVPPPPTRWLRRLVDWARWALLP
jgi:hypothetical protein